MSDAEVETPLQQINKLQKQILEGGDPSVAEMTLVIQSLRSERVEATLGAAKTTSRTPRASATPIDFDALFAKLKANKEGE